MQASIYKFISGLSGKSPRTRDTYATALNRFVLFIGSAHNPASLTIGNIEEYAKVLEDLALSPRTRRLYLIGVRKFYRWLVANKILPMESFDVVRLDEVVKELVPRSSPLPHIVDPDDIARLLKSAEHVESGKRTSPECARLIALRDQIIIRALSSSGMRVGELVALRRGDLFQIVPRDSTHHVYGARVVGKGNKERIVYFDDVTWGTLQNYMHERGDGSQTRALSELPVVVRHNRKQLQPLTTWMVEKRFKVLCKRAGVADRVTPHSLRHAFATLVYEATDDIAVVQEMLGHSSPQTTRIYAKVSSKKMRDAHRIAFTKERERI